MLDLSPQAVEQWLLEQPGGHRALRPGLTLEALPTVLIELRRLSASLEDGSADLARLGTRLSDPQTQAAFRSLLQFLSTGRRLRLVSWILEVGCPAAPEIVAALFDPNAHPAGVGTSIARDVQRHHRLSLLETICAPERVARVLAACEGMA